MMNLTETSVNRPVFAWMLMASLIIFGLISFRTLGVGEKPDVDFPIVNISVSFSGASPEVIESDIIDIIENAVMGTEGLKSISSSARFGDADIKLEFDINRDVDVALQEVQSKVGQAQRRLPKDIDPPSVTKSNPEDQPIMWIALSGDVPSRDLMSYAQNTIIPQFQMVEGVGDVFLGGYVAPAVRIWIDGQKLLQYELSIDDIISSLNREHIEIPAGLFQKEDKEYTIRVLGEARDVKEISQLIIDRRGGSPIYTPIQLKDVARVELGLDDVRRRSRVLGESAVGVGIRKQRGTNTVAVADGVKSKMAEIEKNLPEKYKIGVNFDSTKFIKETVDELIFELILAALLTGLICWLFLGSLQSTINILLAIPTSLIGAFMVAKYFGFTLNTFTLLALILAVGIVVDDAIMVLENIVRHRQMGKSRFKAALEGTNQIYFAAVATTFAIVAIFIPVVFMEGVIGKYFYQFGIMLSAAVLLSLLEALTLTPMRCSQFLEKDEKHGPIDKYVKKAEVLYRNVLNWALHRRWSVLIGSFLFFCLGFLFLFLLKKEFSPSQDQGLFMVRLRTAIGSSLDHTDSLVQQAESKLKEMPDVSRFFVAIGGFGGGQVNSAMMFVTLKDHNVRKRSQIEIMSDVRKSFAEIKGLRTIIQDLSLGGMTGGRGFPIEFSVLGPDWDKLVEITNGFVKRMEEDPRFADADSNYDEGMPEIQIRPNRAKASLYGVSVNDIASTVSLLVGGERVSRFTEAGKRIDMRIRLEEAGRVSYEDILKLKIRNNRGELVPLKEIVDLEIKNTLVSITRENRQRAIKINANIAPTASQADLIGTIESWRKELPAGYSLALGGSSSGFADSSRSLMFALILGILVAYMILASQFNSFIDGFTVLLSLPFSLTGAWMAMWAAGVSLNMYSFIGLILLTGIVKKNAIMLVDFTNQKRREGLNVNTALMEACPIRLRPILMTSITVISASIPPVLGMGPGSETRVSMSVAVIGGVFLSTIFTLLVVPCAHSLLSRELKPIASED